MQTRNAAGLKEVTEISGSTLPPVFDGLVLRQRTFLFGILSGRIALEYIRVYECAREEKTDDN